MGLEDYWVGGTESNVISDPTQRCHECEQPLREGDRVQGLVVQANDDSSWITLAFVHIGCPEQL